jgi:hypothetical protein
MDNTNDLESDIGSYSSNKRDKFKYINLNNDSFDIQKVKCIPDEKNYNIYKIRYGDENTNFYIIPDKAFRSYGLKNKYDHKKKIRYNNYDSDDEIQISIVLDDQNKHHNVFKSIINKIYNKLDINFKKNNIKVYNPISDTHNTMNFDINEDTILYKFENQQLSLMKLEDLIYFNNIPYKIQPYIYIKNLKENNKTLYMNFVAKVVIIEFKKCYISFDHGCFAFSEDPRDNDSNDTEQSNISDKVNKEKRVRF